MAIHGSNMVPRLRLNYKSAGPWMGWVGLLGPPTATVSVPGTPSITVLRLSRMPRAGASVLRHVLLELGKLSQVFIYRPPRMNGQY